MTHCFFSHLSFEFFLFLFFLWIDFAFSGFSRCSNSLANFFCWTLLIFVLLFLFIVMLSKVTSQLFNNIFSSHSLDFTFLVIIILNLFHHIHMVFNPFVLFILSSVQLKFNENTILVLCFQESFNIFLQILSLDIFPSINIVLNCLKGVVNLVFRILFIFSEFVHTEYITFLNCFVRLWFKNSPFFNWRLPVFIAFFLSLSLFNGYFFLPFLHLFKLLCSFQLDFL